jgi:hypothetical protein
MGLLVGMVGRSWQVAFAVGYGSLALLCFTPVRYKCIDLYFSFIAS